MFKKKTQLPQAASSKPAKPASVEPKYDKPKILLIDMDEDTQKALRTEGHTVETGSFGTPYKVERSDNYRPLITEFDIPNHTEQEIIIIDLVPSDPLDNPKGEKLTSEGENDWWVSCSKGVIDPRPRVAASVKSDFDNILSHGGIFVIFADSPYKQKIKWASVTRLGLDIKYDLPYDNWGFLSVLNYFVVGEKSGKEITVINPSEYAISQILSKHIKGGSYFCTLTVSHPLNKRWLPLAENKFKETVGGVLMPSEGSTEGWVFILPQIRDKSGFLAQLLKEVLPNLAPDLFPHLEGARWVNRPEYKLPEVLNLENRIQAVEEEAQQKISELEAEIEKQRLKYGYLYDLVTETGSRLVGAVKRALEEIGFRDVIDVDEEKEKLGDKGQLREDLQIRDKSPLVLVEVKGITNLPKEAHSLQVWKYLAPRMKQLKRTDIRGLSIINHQKNIPPLERENTHTFSEDILTNAEHQEFGLLTTWDFYRLTRSYLKNQWKHEFIEPLFYQNGRIDPVPINYKFVGTIEKFWENIGVIAIKVEAEKLSVGDRIAFELPVEFEEQIADSLEIDKNPVEKAEVGTLVALKTHLSKQQARSNVRVFRVDRSSP